MLVLLVTASVACASLAGAVDPLGPYRIDSSRVTTGGLSAGAFFAVQAHVAHSSLYSGAAVFAGGPFYCAQGQLTTAEISCMNAVSPIDKSTLAAYMKQHESDGGIDPVSNLANARVFLYSGTGDTVVKSSVVKAAASLYKEYVTSGNVTGEYSIPSEHCQPTKDFGNACSALQSPYINKCDYDGAGDALHTLYGPLRPRGQAVEGNLMEFDQTQFGDVSSISMNDKGFIYVPSSCQSGTQACGLHVNFHGCEQTVADVGNKYAMHAGYNEWAEANGIVVLYPNWKRSQTMPSNPEGCADWWGYSGSDYALKSGKQQTIVHTMVQHVMGTSSAAGAPAVAVA